MRKQLVVISLLLVVSLLAKGIAAKAQELPQISSSVAADTMWIGDQTIYSIEIKKDVSTEIGLPQFKDNKLTDKIEIVEGPWVDTISREDRNVTLNVNYKITIFDAGEYVLQGFPIIVGEGEKPDTMFARTVNHLFVKTFEIDTTKQEIFDIKANLDTPITWAEIKEFILSWKGMVVLGLMILVSIGIWFVIWMRKRRNGESNKPKEPAHIIALRAISALERKKVWESGKVKEYYSILTDIIRVYIENRYGVSTMELTTPEILNAVKELNSEKQYRILEEILSDADLVKFAKHIPSPEENAESVNIAKKYVEETKLIIIEETEQKDESNK